MAKRDIFDEMGKWLDERDAAVKSMDVNVFREWAKKQRSNDVPDDDRVIEITMRKMAVHITSLDIDTRVNAFRWLLENGYDFDLY